jgi:hypothetical protein
MVSHGIGVRHISIIIIIIMEWWGSPLVQEEKYQGREKTCDKR